MTEPDIECLGRNVHTVHCDHHDLYTNALFVPDANTPDVFIRGSVIKPSRLQLTEIHRVTRQSVTLCRNESEVIFVSEPAPRYDVFIMLLNFNIVVQFNL